MVKIKSTHANFSVNDMVAAKHFYIDILGFRLVKEDENSILLESEGGNRVVIYLKADHKAWDSTVFGIEVDDVKAAVDELKDLNVTIEKVDGTNDDGIMSDPEMGDAAWFKDPAGNWVCVSHMNV